MAGPPTRSLAGENIDLVIENTSRLHYRFTIPSCAGNELSRAVALEAERILPVNTKKLMTAYAAYSTGPSSDRLQVELVAVRKRLVDDLCEKVRSYGGVLKSVVAGTDGQTGPIELPLKEVRYRRHTFVAVIMLFLFSFVLLCAQLPAIYLARLEEEIIAVDSRIVAARSATRQVAALQSQMRVKRGLSVAIADIAQRNRITQLLETLAVASPDHVVIENLRVDVNRMHISGTATKPEDWALQLQNYPAFDGVVLLSVRDIEARGDQRFEI
ncbi:unnamed protein product, partial [Ectocarpus sp. 13 AM-2016]